MPVDNPTDWYVDLQLRWGDMDIYQHINNTQYFRLLEETRIRQLADWGAASVVEDRSVVVARHEIDYKQQLHYREGPIRIFSWVSRIGSAGYDIAYVITEPDVSRRDDATVLYAVAETSMVFIDRASGTPRRMTDIERANLEAHLGPRPPLRSARQHAGS